MTSSPCLLKFKPQKLSTFSKNGSQSRKIEQIAIKASLEYALMILILPHDIIIFMKSVDIVVPVYNEEAELEDSIKKLRLFLQDNLKNYNWKIVIADNASKDNTLKIAKDISKKLTNVSFVHLDQKGRGRAIKKTWSESKADFVSYMDVDLSTDLSHFPKIIKALEVGYDIAIGSRLLPKSKVIGRLLKREIISRCYNFLIKLAFLVKFHDAQCGFKATTKKVVNELFPYLLDNEWFLDSELLIVGEKAGYKIYEEPVKWVDNQGSTVKVMKTARGDIDGLIRLFKTRPWRNVKK